MWMVAAHVAAFVAVSGCSQVFGLAEPQRAEPLIDAQLVDGRTGDAADMSQSMFAACASSDATLVACWDFEGNLMDLSATPSTVTATNVQYVLGVHGMAVDLVLQSTANVADAAKFDITAVTMEAWIRPAAYTTPRAGIWDSNGQYGLYVHDDGSLSCTLGPVRTGAGAIGLGGWTHAACSFDSTTTNVYVNGDLAATGLGMAIPTTPTDPHVIGGNSPSGDRFVGAIDQLRIYRVKRTASQICAAAGKQC